MSFLAGALGAGGTAAAGTSAAAAGTAGTAAAGATGAAAAGTAGAGAAGAAGAGAAPGWAQVAGKAFGIDADNAVAMKKAFSDGKYGEGVVRLGKFGKEAFELTGADERNPPAIPPLSPDTTRPYDSSQYFSRYYSSGRR